MTSTSHDTTPASGGGLPGSGSAPPPAEPGGTSGAAPLVAGVAGLVAILCAVLLPLLPVQVDRPVVSWPEAGDVARSTGLALTTQQPLELAASFSCRDARQAAAAGGIVLATGDPRFPDAVRDALLVTARDDRLLVTSRDTLRFDGALPAGECSVAILGDLTGTRVLVDGAEVARLPAEAMPAVDALVSDLDGTPGTLRVRLVLDDQASTSPTPVKSAVTVVLVVAVLAALAALWAADRRHRIPRAGRLGGPGGAARLLPPGRPAVVDLVVPVVLLAWLFLAPMTDDDGYYSAMASNVGAAGYVANYYQLFNQSFTPFTWIYYALSGWQELVGSGPVALRVPALVLGLVTWLLIRVFVGRIAEVRQLGPWPARLLRVVLALSFLGWWLPYNMGVRPEAVVAAGTVASLLALSVAIERRRAFPAGLAVVSAGIAFTAGTTGFVALAPLLAGAPALWRVVAVRGRREALLTTVAVMGTGAVVALLAFVDGSLRDFARAQEIFLGMQYPETWASEIVRWNYLLDPSQPMGNYAKRLPVLLTLLALVGFLAGAVAGRGRGTGWPARVRLTGIATVLAFLLLWLTPSKWTHHFGALAGLGTVLLAAVLVGGPRLIRTRAGDRPPHLPLAIGTLVTVAVVVALAGRGGNTWAYSWLLGLPQAGDPPQVSFVEFGQPVWWLLGAAAVTAAIVLVARHRAPEVARAAPWYTVPVVVAVALAATSVYLVGGFALAAVRTMDTYSPWADALRDPAARDCGAQQQVQVLDPTAARPLPLLPVGPGPPSDPVFVPDGWSPASPPPTAALPAWGSFRDTAPDAPDGAGVGTFSTPWFGLPAGDVGDGGALALFVSGRTGEGNDLRVEYGRPAAPGAAPDVLAAEPGLGEAVDGSAVDARAWRSVTLEDRLAPPEGATAVRLVATDAVDAPGGWTAFTGPAVQRWVPVDAVIPPGSATAVGWPIAFLFPCLRQPAQQGGVNEPVDTVVTWGDAPLSGVADSAFLPERGGLFLQSYRGSVVTELAARLRDSPGTVGLQVYTLRGALPSGRYTVAEGTRTVPGWAPAPNTTFSEPVGPEAVVRP